MARSARRRSYPRQVPTELRGTDDVRAWLRTNVYDPRPSDEPVGAVGLEAEYLPFWRTRGGRPAARLALVELVAIVDGIPAAERNAPRGDGRPSWTLHGALITEEPGAQIEVAGPPEPDTATALTNLEHVTRTLAAAFEDAGAALAAAGLDLWSGVDEVPVQLEVPRYEAMTAYFAQRGGESGHLLMCASCSTQVNVDLGPPATARRRWLLANLVSPVLIAAFAASPTERDVNGRATGWRTLDPTRTGVPPPLVAGSDDPLEHVLADALRADVLLVQRDGRVLPGAPGWSFGDWVRDPHPEYGPPTGEDLRTHLSTLFPEARLRGYLEVRGIDQLPGRWRAAAVTLTTGLLYDEDATEQALETLRPHRARIPDLLVDAARHGLRDPTLRHLAGPVLEAALAGATRLGTPQADDAEAFLDRFTRSGRHPADELRAALARGPADALRWARVDDGR
jgi:glutamate--cysteine ligase